MYVGVTNDLKRRVYEHKTKVVKGFTEKYNVNKLVYYEQTNDVLTALAREKEIKKWHREKKKRLGRTTQSSLERSEQCDIDFSLRSK